VPTIVACAVAHEEHALLTSQQNQVYKAVGRTALGHLEFEWTTRTGELYDGTVPCLLHRPSGSYFIFDFAPRGVGHSVEYSPGEQQPVDAADPGDWPSVLMYLQHWLENVEREQSSPNLWAELERERKLLAAVSDDRIVDNSPFTPEERAQVAAQLDEIKELLVQTHDVERPAVEARIEYLVDASTRMGRRDWLNIFIGGIFGWALNGLVPPEGVREVLALAAHGLAHLPSDGELEAPPGELFRYLNKRIRELEATSASASCDFVCECADDHCFEAVMMKAAEFDAVIAIPGRYLVASGHQRPNVEGLVEQHDRREGPRLTQDVAVSPVEPTPVRLVGGVVVRGAVYVLVAVAAFLVITFLTARP
jgi:hypothetical protein